jgi:hypothetical protein
MSKIPAFGTSLAIGQRQIETATVVGTITLAGNVTVITTASGMTSSPITTNVAVLLADTADTVSQKIRTALGAVANITNKFIVEGSGSQVVLKRLIAAANDATLNISVENGTCTGLTDDTSSENTLAGVVSTVVAYCGDFSGPGVGLDVEDATTHDSTGAWEEGVPTVLRSGTLSFPIVYDPNTATHAAASGLLSFLQNRKSMYCTMTFPNGTIWKYDSFCSGFEPAAPVAGKLSANISVKLTGQPILA